MGAAVARRGAPHPPGWPLLVAASVPAVPWTTVLATVAAALGLAALLPLTPASGDALLLSLAVLVLACGWAAAADERTDPGSPTPVPARRRLLARVLLVVPVSAGALAAVAAVARVAGAHPGRDLFLLWLATGALALAAGAAVRRVVDVPGVAAAAALVGGGLVLVTALPHEALTAAAWDSTGERVTAALVSAALLLAPAVRDPAARPLRSRRAPR